ncbi:Uncharacterised protein [Burkholderia pseudomallei]|uniref:hypothetical protein n=1 Tax=Burkholderia pseudomallei TaxID=28450 RepID=UPI0005E4B669|nr:hypothetical protein [Burkholderia pseudomallei]CAJ9924685.1 Uncharacterised protein [Burkholderia pseudomallei]CAK1307710.1 Uncharacterised protein [Burkholderia pseudomallei]CPG54135.1 Uncharacterised protein [Burkholderia pseudomallei]
MRTRSFIAAVLGFSHAHFVIDPSEPAIDQALAPVEPDAAAAPASDVGESSGAASAAVAGPESDTSSSAAPASLSSDTAAAGTPQGDAPEVAASGEADAASVAADPSTAPSSDAASSTQTTPASNPGTSGDGAAVLTAPAMTDEEIAAATAAIAAAPVTTTVLEADPTPAVSIDVEDHAEACERFAGLLARLHGAEEDFVHALRNELNAIGTLLHLHTVASGKADATGDYSSSDLS